MFQEFKPDYGDTMVTGWAFIWGMKVGILGNNGVIYSEAANKATTFMQLCDRDGIPLLFLHNVTGFMVGREYERRGITKDGAKMLMVQANVTVPKLSVLCHASQGAGNYAMAGRTWDPRLLFAWPNSRSSIMGPEVAADTLTQVRVTALKRQGKDPSAEEIAADPCRRDRPLRGDLPLLLPDLRPARRRPDRPDRHPQRARACRCRWCSTRRSSARPAACCGSSSATTRGIAMDELVIYELADDGVAWLTINRPEARNALSKGVRDGLWAGFRRFADDGDAAVLILTGAGDKAFCAGGDLKEMSETALQVPPPDFLPYLQRTRQDRQAGDRRGQRRRLRRRLPAGADVRPRDRRRPREASAITEAKVGRGSPWAAPLPWLVGPRAAMEIMLTGDPITAQRAYEIGLVNRVVPADRAA